jgi:hypothetical protein
MLPDDILTVCSTVTAEKCNPEISRINFCGIFVGGVSVYGRDQSDTVYEGLSVTRS